MTSKTKATKPEAEMLHTADVAKLLKIDSKKLRKILRSQASKANGGARYEFKDSDLPKLREMIAEHTRSEETAKAAKKAA
jgi:phage antirepressor YoqD-like protein